jgi:CheY-like chemotaxis protein
MNQPPVISGKAASTRKVLILDDNPDIRLLMRLMLKDKYEVLEADTGTAALQLIKDHQPQLVLLDAMMPGELDGLQLLDVIKADPNLKEIVVAIVTARGQTFEDTDARKRGADAYFVKPFSQRQVCAWVDSHLNVLVPPSQ